MSCKVSNLKDLRFGKLLVLEEHGRDKWGQVIWLCLCDCGTTKTIVGGNLRRKGGDQSCGCIKAERIGKLYRTHGKSQTKEYIHQKDLLKRFKKYSITPEEYQTLKDAQKSRCAICGVVPTSTTSRSQDGFSIDHSHVTGRVRGLLCLNCNTGIGMLKDSEKVLQSAIEYLRRASQ